MKKQFIVPVLLITIIIISFKPDYQTNKLQLSANSINHRQGLTSSHENFATSSHFLPPTKFNAILFEEEVNKKMKNTVKGYAFAVGNKDGIMARSEGGWAQDPKDGNLLMSTKIPSCIGSVSKMISSVALLNLLESLPNVKLDNPIFSKLPKKWQQKYAGTKVECITYRQLLQHKSGFPFKGGDTKNLDELSKTKKSCPYNAERKYSNANISLLRYLITGLAYPEEVAGIEKNLSKLEFEEYSKQAQIDYSFPFERYVKKYILEKGLIPIIASCRPEPDFMPKVAKGYNDRNDIKGALVHTGGDHHCAPQGSWYLSAEMLAHFGRTLLFSNNYLTTTTRNMMFDPKEPDESLGWAIFQPHTAFSAETGQSIWPWHNGGEFDDDNEGYYGALLIQLPYNYVGSVVINTKFSTFTLVKILMDAFYEATHSGPVAEIAKHGIPEKSYQEEFSMIWKSGYYPVWVDAYDVNGKTFFNTIFRPNSNNYDVQVRHDMTKESYQQEYNEWVKQKGYRLQQLDNYNDAGKLKLAAIFIKKPGQPQAQPAYHALSPEEHQTLFEKYTGEGYVPVNVSVVSIAGKKYYAAFYEKRNVGGNMLKSFLTQQEYQDLFDDMKAKKWEQVYINAYKHEGQTRFSVIWYEKSGYINYTAIRRGSSDVYQEQWQTHTGNGFLTRCVTGYEEGGKHWFAAHWAK